MAVKVHFSTPRNISFSLSQPRLTVQEAFVRKTAARPMDIRVAKPKDLPDANKTHHHVGVITRTPTQKGGNYNVRGRDT